MANRAVTRTRKDGDGDIIALCNPSKPWSPRSTRDAIEDIESGEHAYFVLWPGGQKTPIRVVQKTTGKYLRADRDDTKKNNLSDLPTC